MVRKLHHHVSKNKHKIQWGLIAALIVSGLLLIYIGYFDKVLFPKIPSKSSDQIVLYYHKTAFGTVVCNNLYPLYRVLPVEDRNIDRLLQSITAGPTNNEQKQGFTSLFSHETESIIQSVTLRGNDVYINLYDLRSTFPASTNCLRESIMISIQKTLQANLGVDRVIFAIDNNPRIFYEWVGVQCGILNDNCYKNEFPQDPQASESRQVTSITEKIKFRLPIDWYAQIDGYDQIENDYDNIITATRITNWDELKTKIPPNNAVQMTIVEIANADQSVGETMKCYEPNPCYTESRGSIDLKISLQQKSTGRFEKYGFTKEGITYIIEIQFPFKNTANREYQVTQDIINDVIIHI